MTKSKTCRLCGETKPASDFYKGIGNRCKPCHITAMKKYHWSRPFYKTMCNAKGRAKKAGIPFDLSEKYLKDIWTGVCPVFGTRLSMPLATKRTDVDVTSAHQPSLDRILPERGYVEGNVVWMSRRANVIKSNATSAEIHAVAMWLHQTEEEIKKHETD